MKNFIGPRHPRLRQLFQSIFVYLSGLQAPLRRLLRGGQSALAENQLEREALGPSQRQGLFCVLCDRADGLEPGEGLFCVTSMYRRFANSHKREVSPLRVAPLARLQPHDFSLSLQFFGLRKSTQSLHDVGNVHLVALHLLPLVLPLNIRKVVVEGLLPAHDVTGRKPAVDFVENRPLVLNQLQVPREHRRPARVQLALVS